MDEEQMNRLMMICCVIAACCAAGGAIILLVATSMEGLHLLIPALLLGGSAVGGTYGAAHFGSRVTGKDKVFDSEIEREVLNPKQRRELRRARSEVVMERALIDIENERQNIVHKQIEASNDDTKPPHVTSFSPPESAKPSTPGIDPPIRRGDLNIEQPRYEPRHNDW